MVMAESRWEFGFEGAGMAIGLVGGGYSMKSTNVDFKHRDSKQPLLSIAMHTPSRSAARVWKETIQHTKRMNLVIEFEPLPVFDEDGNLIVHQWQDWKD